METKQISLTLSKKLYNDAQKQAELNGFRSVQELTVASLRRCLDEDRRYRRIEERMNKGNRTRMTKEEALAYLRGP